jgi:hypothetical protein
MITNIAPTSHSCKHGTLMFPQGKAMLVCVNGMKILSKLVLYLWFLPKRKSKAPLVVVMGRVGTRGCNGQWMTLITWRNWMMEFIQSTLMESSRWMILNLWHLNKFSISLYKRMKMTSWKKLWHKTNFPNEIDKMKICNNWVIELTTASLVNGEVCVSSHVIESSTLIIKACCRLCWI